MTDETPASPFRLSLKQGILPFVAPLATFLILSWLEQPLTDRWSYQAAYTLKILGTLVVAVACWRALPRWTSQGLGLAIAFGLLSCPVWIGLDWAQRELADLGGLNFLVGERQGYAPNWEDASLLDRGFLGLRLLGLVVIVPIIEEVFWRGFLARYLIDEQFEQVEPGKMTALSFVVTTAAFAAVHPEILAAVAWGAGINLVWMKTRNLWACIIAHATTNAALGGYILATGSWHLW